MLSDSASDERDVVYAFVKIRKIIDFGGKEEKLEYWRLNLFCNWLLHVELTRSPVSDFLRESLDQYLGNSTPDKRHLLYTEIFKLLSFEVLRSELRTFLYDKNLPILWTDDDFAWNKLVRCYGEEVRDTPLEILTPRLKRLRKLVITSCEPSEVVTGSNPNYKYFGLQWELTMKDGKSITLPYTSTILEEPPNRP